MTPKDICKLVKLAKSHNVRKLKVGDLEIEFSSSDPGQEISWEKMPKGVATPAKALKSQGEIASKTILQEEIDQRELDLEELLLSDPVEYERMLLAGELDERRDEKTADV